MGFYTLQKKLKLALFTIVSLFKWKKEIPIIVTKDRTNLLAGKVALISGGSGGIGLAIAKSFAESGCKVILAGTNESKLTPLAQAIGGGKIVINLLDVQSFSQKIEETASIFGKIDILVNCSGIHTKRAGFDFLNVTEDEYDKVMDVNLKGTYFMCQAMAHYMINNKIQGHILNISSQSALERSETPYRLSKLGLSGITRGLGGRLLEFGITVNSIGPGPTATSMQDDLAAGSIYTLDNPIHRYTMPEEIAEYAKLMVSDLGKTIVGDTLYMSGGRGII